LTSNQRFAEFRPGILLHFLVHYSGLQSLVTGVETCAKMSLFIG